MKCTVVSEETLVVVVGRSGLFSTEGAAEDDGAQDDAVFERERENSLGVHKKKR